MRKGVGEFASKKIDRVRPDLVDDNEQSEYFEDHLQHMDKSKSDEKLIGHALKKNLIGSSLNDTEIRALINEMKYYEFNSGDNVCEQGTMGHHFFVTHSGEFDVMINDKTVNTIGRGYAFGEIALMYNSPRTATIRCTKEGGLWVVHRTMFREILKEISKRNLAENLTFLDSVSIFDMLTPNQKSVIANALVLQTFQRKEAIVTQGERGDVLYIIQEGTAQVWIDSRVVRELTKGAYFGERALLYDEPRSATIVATSKTVCVSIGRGMLQKVVGNLKHILFRNVMMNCMQNSQLLGQFSSRQLDSLCRNAIIKRYPENYTLIDRELKLRGVRYFIVLEGDVLVSLEGKKVSRLSRCEPFGEDYILRPKMPFLHRVDTITPSTLAFITTQSLYATLDTTDINATLDNNNKAAIIMKMYIFRYLSYQQVNLLINSFREREYVEGETIFKEGDMGTIFYIIKLGEVEILKGEKRLRTLGKNDYFGERALLYAEPRSASVVCVSETAHLWAVDKSVFLELVQGPMLTHLEERIRLQDTNVSFSDLVVLKVVGRGTFGVVKKVKHRVTGTMFALKCVLRKAIVQYKQQENINLERSIMAENDHPFILKLVRTFKDEKYLYFLLELCTGGELYEAIRLLGILTRSQTQFYIASIILSIEYLHERSIAFRDLKPENVLLDRQGYTKLIDFGCAKRVKFRTYTVIGTPHYMAPEVIVGRGYSTSCDIWTIGIMLYELLCGPLPFGSEAAGLLEIYRDVLTGPLTFPDTLTDQDALHLIQKLLCRIPEVRMGCNLRGYEDIKKDPFFNDFNWSNLMNREIEPPFIPETEIYAEELTNETDNIYEEDDDFEDDILDIDQSGWDAEF